MRALLKNGPEHPRVLIIDDSPSYGRMLLRFLEKRTDCRPLLADTGQEGLRLARRCSPALVILDLHLPDMNGFQVLEGLRKNARTRDTRVLVVTGLDDPADLLKFASLRLSADDILTKDDGRGEHRERIKEVVANLRERRRKPSLGSLRIDTKTHTVSISGHEVVLRGDKRFAVLAALLGRPEGRSLRYLRAHVWDGKVKLNTVIKTVERLRKALSVNGASPIEAIPGGYRVAPGANGRGSDGV